LKRSSLHLTDFVFQTHYKSFTCIRNTFGEHYKSLTPPLPTPLLALAAVVQE
jgi:hypothetical protein